MEKSESLHAVKGKSEKIVFAVFFVIFFLYALSLLYPMVWMFFSSLKKSLEYEAGDPFALPKYWKFENYLTSFRTLKVGETGYFGMIWNSLWINVLSIAEGVFVSAAVCYVVAKISFPGRKVVYSVIILQMMLPIYGSMAPALLLSKNLNIYDTPLQVIISSLAVGGSKFLILQAFFQGNPLGICGGGVHGRRVSLAGICQDHVSAGAGADDDVCHYRFYRRLERLHDVVDLAAQLPYAGDGAV